MAKYHQAIPRSYDENVWEIDFATGMRVYGGQLLKEGEVRYCGFCLDEVEGRHYGDETLDYCSNCEAIIEGERQLVLDENEFQWLWYLKNESH